MPSKEDTLSCYRLYAADLFDDPAFREWLNRRVGKGLATWHVGGEPHEFSDVFVIYDHGEGDESPRSALEENAMPEHCWDAICALCEAEGIEYGLLWLLNMEDEE